jgi:hypothetical protein
MSGLNLGVMGSVRAGAGTGYQTGPVSAAEAGFGPGYSVSGAPSSTNALTPNDPFGVAFWVGVGSLALLLFIRHSLPA